LAETHCQLVHRLGVNFQSFLEPLQQHPHQFFAATLGAELNPAAWRLYTPRDTHDPDLHGWKLDAMIASAIA